MEGSMNSRPFEDVYLLSEHLPPLIKQIKELDDEKSIALFEKISQTVVDAKTAKESLLREVESYKTANQIESMEAKIQTLNEVIEE